MPASDDIRRFLLRNVPSHPGTVARLAADRFGISRQAINRHLRQLTERGLIRAHGRTRAREYELVVAEQTTEIPLTPELEEHRVWREWAIPQLDSTPDNVRDICHYGFTEMVNNAADHSEGEKVTLSIARSAISITLWVIDDGVGIFRKIERELGLQNEQEAVLELSKGKLTTDPRRHTGEGIFFTSRLFEPYSIDSGSLFLSHISEEGGDWLLESTEPMAGTTIRMEIDRNSDRKLNDIFDRFTDVENGSHGFDVTHVPVALAQYGDENLVSRSQAKRLLARVDRFRKVLLNFEGVQGIGQSFADEIFRVFNAEHPKVEISYVNATDDVEKMIQRALSNNNDEQHSLL